MNALRLMRYAHNHFILL